MEQKTSSVGDLKPNDILYLRPNSGGMLQEFVVTSKLSPRAGKTEDSTIYVLCVKAHKKNYDKEREIEVIFQSDQDQVVVSGKRESETVHSIQGKVFYDNRSGLYVGLFEKTNGDVEIRAHVSLEEEAIELPLFFDEDADPPICEVPPEHLKFRRFNLTIET